MQQGEHREGQLQRQHDLAQDQQFVDAAVPRMPMIMIAGTIASEARDQSAQPRRHSPVHEPFHHDLAGERAGDGAGLPLASGGGEKHAGRGGAQQRRQRQVCLPDPVSVRCRKCHDLPPGHRHAVLAEKHQRRQHHDRRVDQERDAPRSNQSCCKGSRCGDPLLAGTCGFAPARSGDRDRPASPWHRRCQSPRTIIPGSRQARVIIAGPSPGNRAAFGAARRSR